ncbi:MAG TPA: hypothetical protein ENO00_05400 [Deltaproteobacteria bacterium]|nr:hypothetical protein [Deltaproteobacteria bacterium]
MNQEQLVIFDYSGTLSREAVMFARPESLMKHLKESGLFDLGVENLDHFWEEIVNSTWEQGSTTGIGYTGLIVKRLLELSQSGDAQERHSAISAASSRFVNAYFTHSAPDRRWQPLLAKLVFHPRTIVIVATDHYAEATDYIARFLENLGIPAKSVREIFTEPADNAAVIANSADVGHPKADCRFWKVIKSQLDLRNIRRVLYVDDFGCNEQEGDGYGNIARVEARKETTTTVLTEVFPGEVTVLPFLIGHAGSETPSFDREDQAYVRLIDTTIQQIETWLADDP